MAQSQTPPSHQIHKDYLMNHLMYSRRRGGYGPVPPVVCTDGFTMSVQASASHNCEPPDDEGPWTSVEVGYPNRVEPLLWPYAEGPGNWLETVYARVPIDLVAAVIELHGGMLGGATPHTKNPEKKSDMKSTAVGNTYPHGDEGETEL